MAKTKALSPQARRLDGWANSLTGVGDSLYDKRLGASFETTWLSDDEAEELWNGDDTSARIIEVLPYDMTRERFHLTIPDDKQNLAKTYMAQVDDLQAPERFRKGLEYARCYGGGAIFVGADDGGQVWRPLNMNRIKRVGWLTTLSKRELQVQSFYQDPRLPRFGEPETYRINYTDNRPINRGIIVHESRLIVLQGVVTSRRAVRANLGWGTSVLQRCYDTIRDFQSAWASAALLLGNAGERRFLIEALAEQIAAGNTAIVTQRAQLIELTRSICRAVIMDSKEKMETEPLQIAGLADLLEKYELKMSSTANMPRTKLFGASPGGLNATGESDERNWYDLVRAQQTSTYKPAVERLMRLLFAAQEGPTRGQEPPNWSIKFPSLWQPTDAEKADLRNKQADTDTKYVAAGILLPEEVAESRFGGEEYSTETVLDFDLRAKFEKAQQKQAKLEQGVLAAKALPAGGDPNAGGQAGADATGQGPQT